MNGQPRLRRYIAIRLMALTFCMVVVYTLLLFHYMQQGLDFSATYYMRLLGRDLARELARDPDFPLPKNRLFFACLGESGLPAWALEAFPRQEQVPGRVSVKDLPTLIPGLDQETDYTMFLSLDLDSGDTLFLLSRFTPEDLLPGAFFPLDLLIWTAWALGVGVFLMVILVIRALFRRVAGPVDELVGWAGHLDKDTLTGPRPDFRFEEISRLAGLIHQGVAQFHIALDRERRFLSNASHELRTPIAVILSNAALLSRIRPRPGKMEAMALARIRRAGDNMNQLTQTLLWLHRREGEAPAPEVLDLDALAGEIIGQHRVLLRGKRVAICVKGGPVRICAPEIPLRIGLSNLIRNAFQYADRGEVCICLDHHGVRVENQDPARCEPPGAGADYGFGLGLSLVDQLARKLGWTLSVEHLPGRRIYRLDLS